MSCPPVRHNGKRSYATREAALDAASAFGELYGRRYSTYWCGPEVRVPDGCGMWHLRDVAKQTAKRSARIKEIRETDPERYRVKKAARRKQWRQNRRRRDREAGTDPTP